MIAALIARVASRAFLLTLFRYALAALGGVLAAEGHMDFGQWETITGALMALAAALAGGSDATVDKVTIAGKTVAKEVLPSSVQRQLDAAVSVVPKRTLLDIFIGK